VSADLFFEDVEIGDDIGPVERIISREQARQFLRIRGGDSSPSRFTEDAAARKEGLPRAIVPGAMNIALMSQLLTGWSHTVRLKKLDVVFRGMVPHDRPLYLKGIITDKYIAEGEPLLECDVFMEDETGTQLVIGNAIVTLPMRESRE
jgi:hypothetical protein